MLQWRQTQYEVLWDLFDLVFTRLVGFGEVVSDAVGRSGRFLDHVPYAEHLEKFWVKYIKYKSIECKWNGPHLDVLKYSSRLFPSGAYAADSLDIHIWPDQHESML